MSIISVNLPTTSITGEREGERERERERAFIGDFVQRDLTAYHLEFSLSCLPLRLAA